jgi:hypothetical protein
MNEQLLVNSIAKASLVIGKTWPLYSFVTSNPLSGYEQSPFIDAVCKAKKFLNARIFPKAATYRQALQQGAINEQVLKTRLQENKLLESPEFYLSQMVSEQRVATINPNHELDRIMVKWLAAFMDEGLAEWEMPFKNEGFYGAWRLLARYDNDLPVGSAASVPKTSLDAIAAVLKDTDPADFTRIFTYHLAALPGWTGYINHRSNSNSLWQQEYPICIEDYLGVRLWVAHHIHAQIAPAVDTIVQDNTVDTLKYVFLQAWENTWQHSLVATLKETASTVIANPTAPYEAQMVFCIDTRSELIRRHVEAQGNYETYGYAGFFGIAMDYTSPNDGLTRKACPPILGSAYEVVEIAQAQKESQQQVYLKKNETNRFQEYFLKRLKNILPSSFGYVEGSGLFYGISLIARTLAPGYLYKSRAGKKAASFEHICEPALRNASDPAGQIPLDEKVGIVKCAFELMGWKEFAPVIIFVGHGSHTANNPFASSLDCGACAASPGRHNARMLASLANLSEVRSVLSQQHGIHIPDSTLFIGAEHNTTTDSVVLFNAQVPASHMHLVSNIQTNLLRVQEHATQDRLKTGANGVAMAQHKASDWSETRPEWGLAKNASFIVAPRSLTKQTNLNGRCFLHSYDWEMDITGQALEGIMQGPMVVTQWINNHYYFATVDNDLFGSGSKITHNVTGSYGVVQGNGGDLKMGLPVQSLNETDDHMYHQPLRLSVVIKAPLARVIEILERNAHLQTLVENVWIYLLVMDPHDGNKVKRYTHNLNWVSFDSPLHKQPVPHKHPGLVEYK